MAFTIKFSRILPLYPDKIFLQWELNNPPSSPPFIFTLDISGASEGPWENLFSGEYNNYWYLDESFQDNKNLYSLNREVFYRLNVMAGDGTSAEIIDKIEAGLNSKFIGIRNKLRRDLTVFLKQNLFGSKTAILKVKKWGVLCTNCSDSTGQPILSHCTVCNGQRFVAGYWNPVYVQTHMPTESRNTQTTDKGDVEKILRPVRMLDLPFLERHDVLVYTETNRRFMVEAVDTLNLKLNDVNQVLSVSEIDRSNRVYKIPVDDVVTPQLY